MASDQEGLVAEEKVLPVDCEMHRLGVGRCEGYSRMRQRYELNEALEQIRSPWAFSTITSSHQTYGYICILDRSRPENRPLFSNANVMVAVGVGAHPETAVLDAIEKAKALDEAMLATPLIQPDPLDG